MVQPTQQNDAVVGLGEAGDDSQSHEACNCATAPLLGSEQTCIDGEGGMLSAKADTQIYKHAIEQHNNCTVCFSSAARTTFAVVVLGLASTYFDPLHDIY